MPEGAEGQTFRIINCGTSGYDVTVDGDGDEQVSGADDQDLSDEDVFVVTFNETEGWF